ncbi:MAG: hypothetical protein H7099_15530 [Gemmatimonadaceae bacterium]|nr:hypothetical protein [Gemmatimonadaceae bacterium]
MIAASLTVSWLTAQAPPRASPDACALVSRAAIRRLSLPHGVKSVPDSGGVICRWGSVADGRALVIKTYATLEPARIARMRIAAAKTADTNLEPTVSDAAWSMGAPFGIVLVAGRHGKGVQLQYYVRPHSTGADRVDVRATNSDREALLEVARVALSRL